MVYLYHLYRCFLTVSLGIPVYLNCTVRGCNCPAMVTYCGQPAKLTVLGEERMIVAADSLDRADWYLQADRGVYE